MEDAEIISELPAADVDKSRSSLNPNTLKLLEQLGNEHKYLSDMLRGAWAVLESSNNPDMLPQAAHSVRELIEKAPYYIDAVPIQSKDPNKKPINGETRKDHIKILVTTYAGKDGQISEHLLNALTESIWSLRKYMLDVAHHGKETDYKELKRNITSLENILFNFLNPQPIDDLENLDALIQQGELV